MMSAELFSRISNLVISYETGDFLLLSEFSDALASLKDFFLGTEEACALIDSLHRIVLAEMKKAGNADFQKQLSEGLDLLQQTTEATTPERRQELIERMTKIDVTEKSIEKAVKTSEQVSRRDDESFQIFLSEVSDRLDQAQTTILELEEDKANLEHIQTLFRIFHTIKGECGFLKIASLGELTHNLENLLDALRNRTVEVSPAHIDLLLEGVDISRQMSANLSSGEYVMLSDVSADSFIRKLQQSSGSASPNIGELLVTEGKMEEADVVRVLQKQKESAFTKRFGEIAVKENYLTPEELRDSLDRQRQGQDDKGQHHAERTDPVIKVRSTKVDFLVDMIGELIIAMGQVNETSPAFTQMRKITRSLQYGAMELRTDSVRTLFGNVRRMVRDLSKQLGKDVRLETEGEEFEIDRNLIEKLEEPLMHMVRNSLDHGFGTPSERQAEGKPQQCTILLKAERRGNSIVISVRDDGRGLDRDKIVAKAIEKGMLREDTAAAMTDEQAYNLIFAPGFSTKDKVSQISGRGVGMDIVRSMVTRSRGRIEIETKRGSFTEIRLVFPLSTAIIDGMIVRVNETLFIFPIASVIESVKITNKMISSVNNRVEVVNLRGEMMPVVRLHEAFNIPRNPAEGPLIGVIAANSERRKFVLAVDEVIAKREVVIKSLGNRFRDMKGISSGTVLAGGKIGFVLDVDQIIELSIIAEHA